MRPHMQVQEHKSKPNFFFGVLHFLSRLQVIFHERTSKLTWPSGLVLCSSIEQNCGASCSLVCSKLPKFEQMERDRDEASYDLNFYADLLTVICDKPQWVWFSCDILHNFLENIFSVFFLLGILFLYRAFLTLQTMSHSRMPSSI